MFEPAVPRRAIVLAAGMGTRLRSAVQGSPKGLLEIGGETLVGRSLRLLRAAGIARTTIVAGYAAEHYRRFAAGHSDVQVLENDRYATTGSMASLAVALDTIDEAVLVLESDIVYESRALPLLLSGPPDATLVSGPTGAGDEVWVYAPGGDVVAMDKDRSRLTAAHGEFVGITRLSAVTARAMRQAFAEFAATHGHGRMDYESDALVQVAKAVSVKALLVPDLCWGEIDDEHHLARVMHAVMPALVALDRGESATPPL